MAIENTRTLISQIANASQVGENTATRVGGAMDAILDDVTDININASVFSLPGSNLAQDGTIGTIADFCVTPLIPVEVGETIKVGGYSGGTGYTNYSLLCAYDADGAFVANYGDGGSNGFAEYTLTIPNGVSYVRVGTRTDTQSTLYLSRSYVRCRLFYKLLDTINVLSADVPELGSEQKKIFRDLSSRFYATTGFVRASTGAVIVQANCRCTDYLPVDGSPIFLRGLNRIASYVPICVFYDEDKNFISHYDAGSEGYDITTVITNIPATAKYFRANARYDYIDNAYCLFGIAYYLYTKVLALDNINNVSTDILGTTIADKVINSSTGVETNLSLTTYPNQKRTDYIAVTPNQKLKISGLVGSSVGFAGYDATKTFASRLCDKSASSVYSVTSGIVSDLEITIPAGVYYVRGSSMDNVANPLRVYAVNDIQTSFDEVNTKISGLSRNDKIIIEKVDATTFDVSVPQLSTGKYLVHRFVLMNFTKTLNYGNGLTKSVLCSDIWNPSFIMYGGNNVIQGNLNFIYMIADSLTSDSSSTFYNENGHVGSGHGGEIKEFQRFFADGVEFDPTQLTNPLECSVFSIICKANDYAIDTTQPGYSSGTATLKLDNNGDPTITAVHTYTAEYRVNNVIVWDNNLQIKRNGLKFQQCHGSMCQGWYPALNNVVLTTPDYDNNDYNLSNGAVFTPIGSSVNLNSNRYQTGGGVILSGADYQIRQKMTQQGSRYDKNYLMIQPYTNDPRLKVYLQPVKTQTQFGASGAETFNDGDMISVHVERAIEFNV